jgi:hypothetical protein
MIRLLGRGGQSGRSSGDIVGGHHMNNLNLSAPTMPIFLIAVALALLALLGHFASIQILTLYQFWLALGAFVLLAIGNLVKGM